jgi:hypothetical protein
MQWKNLQPDVNGHHPPAGSFGLSFIPPHMTIDITLFLEKKTPFLAPALALG